MEKGYFMAVCDQEIYCGKKNEMNLQNTERYMTLKFVDSPETAFLNIIDEVIHEKSRWHMTEQEYLKDTINVSFNNETKEYIIEKLYTLGWNEPKDCQLKCFNDGEYEFYKEVFYIQILKTNLVEDDVSKNAFQQFIKKRWK